MGVNKNDKYMPLMVTLKETKEKFKIRFITPTSTIKEVKSSAELATGIPYELQVLHYLDEADLNESSNVRQNDIVSGATLQMSVWNTWRLLIEASALNDFEWLVQQGTKRGSEFQTPTSEYMLPRERLQWLQHRMDIALMIAAHRGHSVLCKKLLAEGANVNATTSLGRTALHFSATEDHGETIKLLLHAGANIDLKDRFGKTALAMAHEYGNKNCQRNLFMFQWQQRAQSSKPQYLNPPMMEFQAFDSSSNQWKTGPAAQFYVRKFLPPNEYQGGSLNSKKTIWQTDLKPPRPSSAEQNNNFKIWWEKKKALAEAVERQRQLKHEKEAEKQNERQRILQERVKERQIRSGSQGRNRDSQIGGRSAMDPQSQLADNHDQSTSVNNMKINNAANDDYKLAIADVLHRRGLLDPNLNAYEQWLKSKKPHVHDHNDLSYKQMIREFCQLRYPAEDDAGFV